MRRWIRKDRTGKERRKIETHCHEMKERKKTIAKSVRYGTLFVQSLLHLLADLTN